MYNTHMSKRIKCTDEQIIETSNRCDSAALAASQLGIQYSTYRKHAIRLGVFKTNQPGLGRKKPFSDDRKIHLVDVLDGKHPQYQSNKLRIRLIKEGYKEHKCECCGITEWRGFPAPLELDHIDGNRHNHKHENLRLLCPNCHSQTETYRGRNIRSTASVA